MEPILPKVSLSAVMQKALETEFSRLVQSSDDLIFAESLQEATKNFWKQERAHLAHASEVLVDHFLRAAVQDHDYRIFKLYAYSKRMEREDLPKTARETASDEYGEVAGDILTDFVQVIFKSLASEKPVVSSDRLAEYCEEGQDPDANACSEWLSENHPDMWPFIDEFLEKRLDKYGISKEMLT